MLKQQEDEFELQSQIQLEGFQDELLTKLKLKEKELNENFKLKLDL